MASSYTKDLNLEVAFKLRFETVFSFSITSNEWSSLLRGEFWMTKFIRNFGSILPEDAIYVLEYVVMENLTLDNRNIYVIKKNYIGLLTYMLSKWKVEDSFLVESVKSNNIEVVKLLLDNGADIHYQGDEPLLFAAVHGHLPVIRFLLANGVDIHTQDDEALSVAVNYGHLGIVAFLVDNGANVDAQNSEIIYSAHCSNVEGMFDTLTKSSK